MQYNEGEYNSDSYNLTAYSQTASETVALSDSTVAFSVGIVKTDSQGTADLLSDQDDLAAKMETVTIYQHAYTPFAYNGGMYGMYMYNTRIDEDEILLMATKVLTSTATVTDVISSLDAIKMLADAQTSTDALALMPSITELEVVLLEPFTRVEVSNKALNNIIRVNDWLTIDQSPQSNGWGDD